MRSTILNVPALIYSRSKKTIFASSIGPAYINVVNLVVVILWRCSAYVMYRFEGYKSIEVVYYITHYI